MYFILYARVPYFVNIIGGPVLAYVAIVFNVYIIVCLCNKSTRNPTTVIMQGLATADAMTAFCIYGFVPLFAPLFQKLGRTDHNNDVIEIGSASNNLTTLLNTPKKLNLIDIESLVFLDYPFCIIHYCASNFAEAFHVVSVLLTTSLGIQKCLAVAFPIYYRMRVSKANRNSFIVCIVSFLFSIALTMPRLFVVQFKPTETNTCIVSEPNKNLEKYILKNFTIIYSFVLAFAVILMVLSTGYILSVLLFRKRMKEGKSVSNQEARSCVLIVCVLIVFVLSEIPRLYVYGRVFLVYQTNVQKDNIAWKKAKTEIDSRSKCCLKTKQGRFLSQIQSDLDLTLNFDCKDENETSGMSNDHESWISNIVYNITAHHYTNYTQKLVSYIDPHHRDMIEVIMNKISTLMLNNLEASMVTSMNILKCNQISQTVLEKIKYSYEHAFSSCDISRVPTVHDKMANLILGSSPYSEPLNYILNIFWRENDVTLNEIKVYIEVYKFCSVIACSSNFIIYIVMSKTLRETFLKAPKMRSKKDNSIRSTSSYVSESSKSSWRLSTFKLRRSTGRWVPPKLTQRGTEATTSFHTLNDT